MRAPVAHLRRHGLAYTALVFALAGGTAYGAERLGSRDIRVNAVHSRQLAPAALGTKQGFIHSKRLVINDPMTSPSDQKPTKRRLLRYGPFTIRVSCTDNGGSTSTSFKAEARSSRKAYASGISPETVVHHSYVPLSGTDTLGFQAVNVRGLNAFTYSGAQISVQVFEVNKASGMTAKPDCTVWADGMGRK